MIFGTIKGHDVVTMSKKKVEKANFGTPINSVIPEKSLQEEVLMALEDGGQVYALYKKKEMMACYILTKELVNTAEYAVEEEREGQTALEQGDSEEYEKQETRQNQQQMAYVLKKEYIVPEAESVREEFEKVILEEVKESTVYHDVKYIAWKDTLLAPEKVKLGGIEIAGGMGMGIALGILFGVALDHLAIGICMGVAFGYIFSTNFRTLYRIKGKQ